MAFSSLPSVAAWAASRLQNGLRGGVLSASRSWLGGGGIDDGPSSSAVLESDGLGSWVVDGRPSSLLDGCLDVDLESSAMTNALPLRRLSPGIGDAVQAPAAFVRVEGLDVQRLEQRYVRLPDESHGPSFDYEAPAFAFACRIDYDASGLVVSYPEIAERVA